MLIIEIVMLVDVLSTAVVVVVWSCVCLELCLVVWLFGLLRKFSACVPSFSEFVMKSVVVKMKSVVVKSGSDEEW